MRGSGSNHEFPRVTSFEGFSSPFVLLQIMLQMWGSRVSTWLTAVGILSWLELEISEPIRILHSRDQIFEYRTWGQGRCTSYWGPPCSSLWQSISATPLEEIRSLAIVQWHSCRSQLPDLCHFSTVRWFFGEQSQNSVGQYPRRLVQQNMYRQRLALSLVWGRHWAAILHGQWMLGRRSCISDRCQVFLLCRLKSTWVDYGVNLWYWRNPRWVNRRLAGFQMILSPLPLSLAWPFIRYMYVTPVN